MIVSTLKPKLLAVGHMRHFLSEANTVRRRPGFGDLKRDPQSA